MAGRRAQAPRFVASLVVPEVSDEATSRAFDQVRTAVTKLQSTRERTVVEVDLLIGTNKIPHGLGRACLGYTVTPSVATIAFAHAIDRTNPRPDREVWISVVGSDMPDALVEVW